MSSQFGRYGIQANGTGRDVSRNPGGPPRATDRRIVDAILVLSAMMIAFAHVLPPQITRFFLFGVFGLSTLLGAMGLLETLHGGYLNRTPGLFALYILTAVATLGYAFLLRNVIPPAVVFLTSVMFLLHMYLRGMDRRNIHILIAVNVALAFVHLGMSLLPNSYNRYAPHHLTLAYGNPNMTGIVIVATVLVLLLGMHYFRTISARTGVGVLAAACTFLLYRTGNRASMVSLMVVLVLWLFLRKRFRIPVFVRVPLVLSPLLGIAVYAWLPSVVGLDAMFLRKVVFSGRNEIWTRQMEAFFDDPFALHTLPTGGLNMYVAGFVEFGALGFFAFICLLLALAMKWKPLDPLIYRRFAFLAFLCVFVQQTFEHTLVLGSYGVYIFNYALLGVACSRDLAFPPVPTARHAGAVAR